jgi:NAD(P)H dehydrogenase (quinone)
MKISVILAHPTPGSFNHAIARAATEALIGSGHDITLHDLYAEDFDPILPGPEIARDAVLDDTLAAHCAEIAAADGIVIVHPNWWGQPPAILKGWVDRILRPGVAYEFLEGDSGEGVPVGLLQAQAAVVFNTSNTPAARELSAFGAPLETLWRNCIFGLCGVARVERRMFGVVVTSTPSQRQEWLRQVRELVTCTFRTVNKISG